MEDVIRIVVNGGVYNIVRVYTGFVLHSGMGIREAFRGWDHYLDSPIKIPLRLLFLK